MAIFKVGDRVKFRKDSTHQYHRERYFMPSTKDTIFTISRVDNIGMLYFTGFTTTCALAKRVELVKELDTKPYAAVIDKIKYLDKKFNERKLSVPF